jgi:hypothetical protein
MSRPLGSATVWRSQRVFAFVAGACLVLWLGVLGIASEQATPASRPNIVLMFPDNLGWGEVNVYGGDAERSRRGWIAWPPKDSGSTTSTSSSPALSRARR